MGDGGGQGGLDGAERERRVQPRVGVCASVPEGPEGSLWRAGRGKGLARVGGSQKRQHREVRLRCES